MSKLNYEKAEKIRWQIYDNKYESDIAREYGVTRQTINLIKFNLLYPGVGPDVSGNTQSFKKNHRIQVACRKITELHLQGKGRREIREAIGVSPSDMYLLEKHLPFRLRRSPKQNKSTYIIRSMNKLVPGEPKAIRILLRRNVPADEIAAIFNVSIPTVYAIKNNRIWKQIEESL